MTKSKTAVASDKATAAQNTIRERIRVVRYDRSQAKNAADETVSFAVTGFWPAASDCGCAGRFNVVMLDAAGEVADWFTDCYLFQTERGYRACGDRIGQVPPCVVRDAVRRLKGEQA